MLSPTWNSVELIYLMNRQHLVSINIIYSSKQLKKAGIEVPAIFEFTSNEKECKAKNRNTHGSMFLLTFDYVICKVAVR